MASLALGLGRILLPTIIGRAIPALGGALSRLALRGAVSRTLATAAGRRAGHLAMARAGQLARSKSGKIAAFVLPTVASMTYEMARKRAANEKIVDEQRTKPQVSDVNKPDKPANDPNLNTRVDMTKYNNTYNPEIIDMEAQQGQSRAPKKKPAPKKKQKDDIISKAVKQYRRR